MGSSQEFLGSFLRGSRQGTRELGWDCDASSLVLFRPSNNTGDWFSSVPLKRDIIDFFDIDR